MKNFNQKEFAPEANGQQNASPLRKALQNTNAIAIAGIFILIVLHFVSQFTIFKVETAQNAPVRAEIVPAPENQQVAEIKVVEETKNLEAVETVERVTPVVAQPKSKPAPVRVSPKKKEPRETRAERLRRAERILTGV